jgi:hypothetical protein
VDIRAGFRGDRAERPLRAPSNWGRRIRRRNKLFFPSLAPKLFNFIKLFFPGLFNNAAFCLTHLVSVYMSLSAPCVCRQQQRQYSDKQDDESEEVKRGHSKNAAGRSSVSEGIGKGGGEGKGRVMNEMELFCFCCQCICVSKQMFML